jgi:transcriptional regulator NrdR family protein
MMCPECGKKTRVVDYVKNKKDCETYRKRKCGSCGHIFYTAEYEVDHNDSFHKKWTRYYRNKKE